MGGVGWARCILLSSKELIRATAETRGAPSAILRNATTDARITLTNCVFPLSRVWRQAALRSNNGGKKVPLR